MVKLSKNQPCPKCGRFENRGISIDTVITRNNKILLIKRGIDPFKGFWGLPGGYVSWDESVEDAVKREAKEETTLDVSNLKLIGVYSNPKRHPKQVINIAYLVDSEGKPKASDDVVKCKWYTLNSLPEKLAFDHRKIIKDALNLS